MNAFFRNKPGTKSGAAKPTVRKETILVPVKSTSKTGLTARSSSSTPSTPQTPPAKRSAQSATTKPKDSKEKTLQRPAQRAIANARGVKRKSATPQPEGPLFSDSENDDDGSSDIGASDSDVSRKRMKSSVSSLESIGPRRDIVLKETDKSPLHLVHSADLTSGPYESKYQNPWDNNEEVTVKLQYPSRSSRERFQLKWPKQGSDEYKPFDDMKETIKHVVMFYFPEALREKYLDDSSGFERRFHRAWIKQSVQDWVDTAQEYNTVVRKLVEDGSIQQELSKMHTLDLELVKRILDQIYSRTVSLSVEKLKVYKFGTDNVYGELLPRFVREIFDKVRLKHEHVFVDLGSGVGNVVLQAALDIGCESWGIEMMKTPCELAELQANEFAARTRLWGLSTGKVKLLQGDFTESPKIAEVLKRADLVLVNNQAFTSDLNEKLTAMFLDLKDGARVVSLKPFVPDGHRISARNIGSPINQFVQVRFEWYPDYVSWGGNGGHYYIATKDPRPLEAFMRKHNIR
ncbi:hypothetical protein AMS68_000817 [Peltaster fructicola]|uniref:Histone-lysine N-methyltransferase, H3 lysine-79 specific n=1 Tax=Peltaster fructicola TaxID=286661 RepID=A0A6H0XLC1_9PEZI|nr:hypothetical protein AMS68_000817 [Peltaster fructicola]